MANDNFKHEDKSPGSTSPLQWNELGFRFIKNEPFNSSGIANVAGANNPTCTSVPFSPLPSGEIGLTPQYYSTGMPPTGVNLITDVSHFNQCYNPKYVHEALYGKDNNPDTDVSHFNQSYNAEYVHEALYGKDNNPGIDFPQLEGNTTPLYQYHTPDFPVAPSNVINVASHVSSPQTPYLNNQFVVMRGNSASNLKMVMQNGEVNSSLVGRPPIIRNVANSGHIAPVSCHTIDSDEIGMNNNTMFSAAQSIYPEELDGSFLTLGIGSNTEAMSNSNFSGRNVGSSNERVVLPQPNTFCGEILNQGSLNPGLNMAGGFSCFQNNVDGFYMLPRNEDDWSFPNDDQNVYGINSGSICNPSHIIQTPHIDEQHHYSMASNRNLGPGNGGKKNAGFAGRFAGPDPNNVFQGYSTLSSVPLEGNQVELPDSRQSQAIGLSLTSSPCRKSSARPVYDQSQNHSMVSPPIGVTRSTSLKNQFGSSSRPQVIGPSRSSRNSVGAVTSGQEIPGAKASRTSQASNAFTGPSLKRGSIQPSLATYRGHPKRNRTPSAISSFPIMSPSPSLPNISETALTAIAPAALSLPHHSESNMSLSAPPQTASVPPLQPRTASPFPPQPLNSRFPLPPPSWINSIPQQPWNSPPLPSQPWNSPPLPPHTWKSRLLIPQPQATSPCPPRAQIAPSQPLQQRTAPPQPLQQRTAPLQTLQKRTACPLPPPRAPPQTASAVHIKWQGFNHTPQPVGQKCFLCKRDLSYTAEGPVYIPTVPPPVAILPCWHTFHDHCLQLITPQDQVKNPPCIPCAMAER